MIAKRAGKLSKTPANRFGMEISALTATLVGGLWTTTTLTPTKFRNAHLPVTPTQKQLQFNFNFNLLCTVLTLSMPISPVPQTLLMKVTRQTKVIQFAFPNASKEDLAFDPYIP
jgi:hypothetical protein